MRSTMSEMLEIFVFERQIWHAKQLNLSVKITNSNAYEQPMSIHDHKPNLT